MLKEKMKKINLNLQLSKIYLLLLALIPYSMTEHMKKIIINTAMVNGAVCNDGSPGIYYISRAKSDSNWLIFLESGGGCANEIDCNDRFQKSRYLMSSGGYPDTIEGRTIFLSETYENYNKVIVVYCSSDLWLGNSTFNIKSNQFHFKGAVIINEVMNELYTAGLRNSKHILLAGSSAGGIGALNHAVKLQSKLSAEISVILDSAWFINFEKLFGSIENDQTFFRYMGAWKQPFCQDKSWGYPCCYSASCLIAKNYIPQNIKILAVQSKYDAYVLFAKYPRSENTINIDMFNSKDIITYVHSLGAQMSQSMDIVKTRDNLSFFLSSCFQHVYLLSSNLWENIYNDRSNLDQSVDPVDDIIRIKHLITSSFWKTIKINGSSINETINDWHHLKSKETLQKTDGCVHAQCNPTCPQLIYYDTYQTEWQQWQKGVLILIIVFIIISTLFVKIVWTVQHSNLRKAHSLYLCSNNKEQTSSCIPTCPPHSCIGISCSGLEFNLPSYPVIEPTMNWSNGSSLRSLSRKTSYVPGKRIIKGVTAYFNPGQLVAIMGPSGAGKTTLLDVLMARKHMKETQTNIYINGLPAEEIREWFVKNSGYVLQLATPYHEELTVRQNLTYCAMMRLPMRMSLKDKMSRVEQVLGQCGLLDLADVVVGDCTGGISGGQKRRLCIALQLLDLPSVVFLDEPTSGLDSASSLELLETLHGLTLSGRLVVVTIHQPRIEIFHMFDTILLLCDGKVAYFGSPVMAPTLIAESLQGSSKVLDASNPADNIMDVLTNERSQNFIVDYYAQSGEIESIDRAILRARRHPQKTLSMKFQKQTSCIQNRLLALDGRSSASQTLSQRLYFPLVFLLYGLSLGTCYWKTNSGVLLMSCYMVFSCASQLFMASVIHGHLRKAFALFALEKADGIGHSHELVLHVFIRIFSQSSIPLLFSCGIIYFCTLREYSSWKFWLTSLIHLQLNQTWIAVIMLVACITPRYSPLVSPLLSAIAGFAGGFLVPDPQMPNVYYWLFYINPTHWAYGGMMKALVSDINFECDVNAPLECQSSAGIVVLKTFGLHKKSPYDSMVILLVMTCLFLAMSVFTLEFKSANIRIIDNVRNWSRVVWLLLQNCFTIIYTFICVELKNKRNVRKQWKEQENKSFYKSVEHGHEYKPEVASQQPIECKDDKNDDTILDESAKEDVFDSRSCDAEDQVDKEEENEDESEECSEEKTSDDDEDEEEDSSYDEDDSSNDDENKCKHNIGGNNRLEAKDGSGNIKSSITSLMSKLQTSLKMSKGNTSTSSSASIPNNPNNHPNNPDSMIKLRMKNKMWRKFANRRKTFTGVIEDGAITTPNRLRPHSLTLPERSPSSRSYSRTMLSRAQSKNSACYATTNGIVSTDVNNPTQQFKVNSVQHASTEIPTFQFDHVHDLSVTGLVDNTFPPDDTIMDINEIVKNLPNANETVIDMQNINLSPIDELQLPIIDTRRNDHYYDVNRKSASVSPKSNKKEDSLQKRGKRKGRKHKKDPKARDTWSKYLDVIPKRHEVYCSLSRLKDDGKVTMRKHDRVSQQRNASSDILREKRKTMKIQIAELRQSFMEESAKEAYSSTCSPSLSQKILQEQREKYLTGNLQAPQEDPLFNPTYFDYYQCEGRINLSPNESSSIYRRPSKTDKDRELLNRLSSARSSRNSGAMTPNTRISRINDAAGHFKYYSGLQEEVEEEDNENMEDENYNSMLNAIDENINNISSDLKETHKHCNQVLPEERLLHNHLIPEEENEDKRVYLEEEGEQEVSSPRMTLRGLSRENSTNDNLRTPSNENLRGSIGDTQLYINTHEDYVTMNDENENYNDTSSKADVQEPIKREFSVQYENNKNEHEHDNSKNIYVTYPMDASPGQRLKLFIPLERSPTQQRKLFVFPPKSPTLQRNTAINRLKSPILQQRLIAMNAGAQELEEIDENKFRLPKRVSAIPEDVSFEYSTSSDESDIIKTNEGFIIPEDTMTKIIGNESKSMKLQEESVKTQEDMERLFKKENFLKNIPVKRTSRLSKTTSMVSQLKSRFEFKTGEEKREHFKRRREKGRSLDGYLHTRVITNTKQKRTTRKNNGRPFSLDTSSSGSEPVIPRDIKDRRKGSLGASLLENERIHLRNKRKMSLGTFI